MRSTAITTVRSLSSSASDNMCTGSCYAIDNRADALRLQEMQAGIQNSEKTVAQRRTIREAIGIHQPGNISAEISGNATSMGEGTSIQLQASSVSVGDQYAEAATSTNNAETISMQNTTGLPDDLKAGIETLSGCSMDDVTVHYNSNKPAELNALAYAQGTDIHIGHGQEKHLPHEAWHVAQQKQGRVKPTTQLKAGTNINNNKALELEADFMGEKALRVPVVENTVSQNTASATQNADVKSFKLDNHPVIQRKVGFEFEMLILVDKNGEDPGTGYDFYNDGKIKATTDHNSKVKCDRPGSKKKYSSIVELVTYPSETDNAVEQLDRIRTLVDIAERSEAAVKQRIPVSQVIHGGEANVYVGNHKQPKQTTDASFQANVGIDIAEFDQLLQLAANDNNLINLKEKRSGYTSTYKKPTVKERHEGKTKPKIISSTKYTTRLKNIAQVTPKRSGQLIESILAKFNSEIPGDTPNEQMSAFKNFKGLLSLMLLYIQLGKTFTEDTLDKNLTQFLSRTNLGVLFNATLSQFEIQFVQKNFKLIEQMIAEITERDPTERLLLYDNSQYPNKPLKLTISQFLFGIIFQGDDGFTSVIENEQFQQYGPDPVGTKEDNATQTKHGLTVGLDKRRVGPVVEIRHTENPTTQNKRFPKEQWEKLGAFFIDRINMIHGEGRPVIEQLINNLQSMVPYYSGVDESLQPTAPPPYTLAIKKIVDEESEKIKSSQNFSDISKAYLRAVEHIRAVRQLS